MKLPNRLPARSALTGTLVVVVISAAPEEQMFPHAVLRCHSRWRLARTANAFMINSCAKVLPVVIWGRWPADLQLLMTDSPAPPRRLLAPLPDGCKSQLTLSSENEKRSKAKPGASSRLCPILQPTLPAWKSDNSGSHRRERFTSQIRRFSTSETFPAASGRKAPQRPPPTPPGWITSWLAWQPCSVLQHHPSVHSSLLPNFPS